MWENHGPVFRVYFSTRTTSFEYELSDADVREVVEWAEAEARERGWTVYVIAEGAGREKGLIALADGNGSFAF